MAISSQLEATAGKAPSAGASLSLRCGVAFGLLSALTVAICLLGPKLGRSLALGGNTASLQEFDIVIGGDHLRLPANVLRFAEQRRTGAAERVDLSLTWPDLQGYGDQTRARFTDVGRPDGLIFLQISQSTMSRDMSGRIEPIYRHLFEGAPMPGPGDLTAHAFKASSGYGAETFLTAPAAASDGGPAYGVRCILPESPALSTSADCQRDVHMGGDLVVLYRFSSQLLPQWRAIDERVRSFVEAKLVP